MDDLLKEAIADAKAVRETALENAKIALEEAFTPRLQSMLSKKIATEMEADDDELEKSEYSEEEVPSEDELELAPEEGDDELAALAPEESEDEVELDPVEDEAELAPEDEVELAPEEGDDEVELEVPVEDEPEADDLDLEAVLRELEADLNEEDEEGENEKPVDESEESDKDKEDKVDENDVSSDIGKADNKVADKANDSSEVGQGSEEPSDSKDAAAGHENEEDDVVKESEEKKDDEEVQEDLDLDEVLKALSEEEDAEDKAGEVEELKKEIKETREVVKFIRAKLNEVNLLNAKLLFSNKLFRAFGLNNDQKLKVVENFDRTTNLREVKLVYATLAESFKKPSNKLVESKGSSSKPVASTKPSKEEVLTEGQEMKNRFKKLANIL